MIINSTVKYIPRVVAGHCSATDDTLVAVLTCGAAGDEAVYVAMADWPADRIDDLTDLRLSILQRVADSGTKQTFNEALTYFPGLYRADYRI